MSPACQNWKQAYHKDRKCCEKSFGVQPADHGGARAEREPAAFGHCRHPNSPILTSWGAYSRSSLDSLARLWFWLRPIKKMASCMVARWWIKLSMVESLNWRTIEFPWRKPNLIQCMAWSVLCCRGAVEPAGRSTQSSVRLYSRGHVHGALDFQSSLILAVTCLRSEIYRISIPQFRQMMIDESFLQVEFFPFWSVYRDVVVLAVDFRYFGQSSYESDWTWGDWSKPYRFLVAHRNSCPLL